MNLAVVLALLLSVALVLAKKPFKESKGNKAAAMHKEADEAIVQAATGTNLIIHYTEMIEYPIKRKF